MTSSTKKDAFSTELARIVQSSGKKGVSVRQVVDQLGLKKAAATEVLRSLKALSRKGEVVRLSRDRFGPPGDSQVATGILRFERGRMVVATDDKLIAIDPAALGDAIGGDKVEVSVSNGTSRDDTHRGSILRVVKEAPRTFHALFRRNGQVWIAEPSAIDEPVILRAEDGKEGGMDVTVSGRLDDTLGINFSVPARPLIVKKAKNRLSNQMREEEEEFHERDGERIAVGRAFHYVNKGEKHANRLIDQLSRGMSVDIPFSPEAVAEAEAVDELTSVPDDVTDLTDEPLVTIDGADAKDFDDAVAAKRVGNDIELLVAIADVSAYVERGGTLDLEARERGSSVYLPGRVYPMLPEHLSNGVCSLVPNRLRRCAWVRILLGPRAGIKSYDVGFGVLKSKARLTYEQVQHYIDGHEDAVPAEVQHSIDTLSELFARLNKKRKSRGMLDLDLAESKIRLSEDGSTVRQVEPYPRWRSHQIIEECMLVTNETVADFLASRQLPCIYRSHDEPDEERLEKALTLISELTGEDFPEGKKTVERISKALNALEGHPMQRVASIAVLKSMQQATYSVDTHGHFGIGARRYAHFTSPIRRYADLEVHRVLRAAIEAPSLVKPARFRSQLEEGAKAANAGEYRAVQAERYAERLLKARYMLDHVGDVYMGRVTGIQPFGAFVTLADMPIEGLAHISGFRDDHYVYNEQKEELRGRKSKTVIKLGQGIEVRCRRVILHEGKVDLEPLSWG